MKDSLMKYISKISRLSILYRSEKLSLYGLNGHQHIYILTICNNPGISQDNLAKMIFVNKSNVTRQISLLVKNGFVTRKVSKKDKRQFEIYPTKKAMDVYPHVKKVLFDWNEIILNNFSENEKKLFKDLIKKAMSNAVSYYRE